MIWYIIGAVPALFLLIAFIGILITQRKFYGKKEKTEDFDFFSFEDRFEETGAPTLIVKAYGDKYRFLLDTGSNKNMLQLSFVNVILQKSPQHTVVRTDTGTRSASGDMSDSSFSTKLPFKLRNLEFDEEFIISDMKGVRDYSDMNNLNIIGILGTEFFNKYQWKIDFEKYIVWHKKNK